MDSISGGSLKNLEYQKMLKALESQIRRLELLDESLQDFQASVLNDVNQQQVINSLSQEEMEDRLIGLNNFKDSFSKADKIKMLPELLEAIIGLNDQDMKRRFCEKVLEIS
jgi:tryptophan 2,3-dioxygenase